LGCVNDSAVDILHKAMALGLIIIVHPNSAALPACSAATYWMARARQKRIAACAKGFPTRFGGHAMAISLVLACVRIRRRKLRRWENSTI
jgi:hypothetical protein